MAVPVAILGAGGDGLVVAETLRQSITNEPSMILAGFLDDGMEPGTEVEGAKVLGNLDYWRELDTNCLFISALHKFKLMHSRVSRIRGLRVPDARWANVIHPSACIARTAVVGAGVFIAANVVVQPRAQIGNFTSIRAGANVGHDATCADFSYVGPNSTICGKAILSEGAHLGPNSVIADGVTVDRYAVVGAGSVVTKRVPEFEFQFGVPARRIMGGAR